MLIIDKSIETGSRLMVARVWGEGGMLVAANGHEFLRVMKMFWN